MPLWYNKLMIIPGKEIADILESQLKKKADNLRAQGVVPQLTTILIGESPDQLSYVSKKKEVAERLGIKFEFLHYSDIPSFEKTDWSRTIKNRG